MKYSELISSEKAQQEFKKAGVENVRSPLTDFDLPYQVWRDEEFRDEYLYTAIIKEIDARKAYQNHQEAMAEHEKKMAPIRERNKKLAAVRPFVQSYVEENLNETYNKSGIPSGIVNIVAEAIVDRYPVDLDETGNIIPIDQDPKTDGMNELDALLTHARIVRLDTRQSIEDMVIREVIDNGFAALMR